MPTAKWLYRPKKSPYWHYEFVLHGDRFHGSTKTDRLPLARKIVEGMRAEILTGAHRFRPPEMTVDHAFGRWRTEVGEGLKEKANLNPRLGRLLDHLGKDTYLSEIGTNAISSYPALHRDKLKPGTINHDLRTLRRVLRRAEKWEVALPPRITWRDLFLPEGALRQRHLSLEEEARLLAALPPDLAMLVRFAIHTGARLDTILHLRWRDIDDAAGTITLRNVKSTAEGETHTLPITDVARAILGSRRGQHAEFVFSYNCQRDTRDRKGVIRKAGQRYPFSDTGWRKTWKKALVAAGIADLRFHDTRHTAGTRITRAKGNLRITQQTLGHKNIATTQRYAHVLLDDVAAGMQAASRNLPEGETPRAATPGVSVVKTGSYKENRRDEVSAPKAGALPS